MYIINNHQFSNLVEVQGKYYMVVTYENNTWDSLDWETIIYATDMRGDEFTWYRDCLYEEQLHAEFDTVEVAHKRTVETAAEIITTELTKRAEEQAKEAEISYVIKDTINSVSCTSASHYEPFTIHYEDLMS